MAASLPGITVNPGVVLTTGMEAYLRQVRALCRAPLTVTSGVRNPSEQASAMLKKLAAGGSKELYDVYQDDAFISRLLATPHNQWAALIASDGRSLSRHLRGGAFDLHTKSLRADQVADIQQAIRATGGKYLMEDAPPHMHVDIPTGLAVQSAVAIGAKSTVKMWAWSSAIGGLVFLGWYLYTRKKS